MNDQGLQQTRRAMQHSIWQGGRLATLKQWPSLPEFTDDMHREGKRVQEIHRTQRNTVLWHNALHGSPLPAVTEAEKQSQQAINAFRQTAQDGMTYAEDDYRLSWRKNLKPKLHHSHAAVVNYSTTFIEASRKAGRFGTRQQLGRTVRVEYREVAEQEPDYLGLCQEFAFDEEEEFDELVPETPPLRRIDYVPMARTATGQLGPAAAYQAEIQRTIERFPHHVQGQFLLEHGHKVEGQGEGITVLLIDDAVIGVYEHPVQTPPSPLPSPPAQPSKRRSVLAAFGLGVLLLVALGLSAFDIQSRESHRLASRRTTASAEVTHRKPHSRSTDPSPAAPRSTESSVQLAREEATLQPQHHIDQPPPPAIPHITGEKIYDSIMVLIEPELCSETLPLMPEKYKDETPAEHKVRMARYQRAFALYDKCFAAYIADLDRQAEETDRIAERVKVEREQWRRRRAGS